MKMSAKIRQRVEFIHTELVQGKPVPLLVEDEKGNYLDTLELLKDLAIQIPTERINYVVLPITPRRIKGESEELTRARAFLDQLGFRVSKTWLKNLVRPIAGG
jgi:hypothetical protein